VTHRRQTQAAFALALGAALLVTTGARAEEPAATAATPAPATTPAAPYAYSYAYPYSYPYPYAAPPKPAPPIRFSSEAEIPPDDEGQFEPGRNRKVNTGKAGKILIGVGLGLAAFGGILTAISASAGSSHDDLGYGQAMQGLGLGIGIGMLVTGGAGVLVGIPLVAVAPRD
jgi:hypothetical protein